MHKNEIYSLESKEKVSESVSKLIEKISAESIKKHGVFRVAISGGSLPKTLALKLKEEPFKTTIEWSKWKLFFADERCVPHDHPDSNYKLVKDEFISRVPMTQDQIFPINECLVSNPFEAAEDYQSCLLKNFSSKEEVMIPNFDLILLGIGPDGHTCSLFPNHPLLQEHTLWVASIKDSPKPPPERITLTFPVLNHAVNIVFMVDGDNKKDVIKDILDNDDSKLPAKMVKPVKGNLYWFLDQAAASELPKSKISPFGI